MVCEVYYIKVSENVSCTFHETGERKYYDHHCLLKLESEESKKILLCKFQADTVVLESLLSSELFHSP